MNTLQRYSSDVITFGGRLAQLIERRTSNRKETSKLFAKNLKFYENYDVSSRTSGEGG